MGKQETFNKVRKHLLSQGQKALEDNVCCYLTKDNLRCAAGCLLPDGYKPDEYENKLSVTRIMADGPEEMKLAFAEYDLNLLSALQRIHDKEEVAAWDSALKSVAAHHGLEINNE